MRADLLQNLMEIEMALARKIPVLLLGLLAIAGCSRGDDEVRLTLSVGPANPGVPPGPTGLADVALLQIRLQATGESMRVVDLRLHAWGSGDDAADVTQVRLYDDVNGDGGLDAGDALITSAGGFSSDDGDLLLQGIDRVIFTTGPSLWLVVFDIAPGPSAGKTFCVGILDKTDVGASWRGRPTSRVRVVAGIEGCMTAPIGGVALSQGPNPPPARTVGPCFADAAVLQVSLAASPVEDVRIDSIAFTASGTGDDAADIGAVRLYVDVDDDGLLGGADMLLAGPALYPADDGALAFAGLGVVLAASSSERWILVYDGAGNIPTGSTYAAEVAVETDVTATGIHSGQPLPVTGAPVSGGAVTIEQPTILSAIFTDTDGSGIADGGDTVLVTFSQDVTLVPPVRADDILSVQPGTFGGAPIGPGATPRELEVVLGSNHFLQPNGTYGVEPGASGVGVWVGQTGLVNCLGAPVPSGGVVVDLAGELNPRIARAGITDSDGDCSVGAGDIVNLVFTVDVDLTTSDPGQAFVLLVAGDSFGTGAQFVGAPMPTSVRTVSILLGASPVLTTAGAFDPASLAPGFPSGVDLSPTPGLVVDSRLPTITALPTPAGGVDVTDPPLWTSVGDGQIDARFGWVVGQAGDVDGDGFDDIVVGAPEFTSTGQFEGKAYVYLGGAGGMAAAPAWTSVGDDRWGARFGTAVASAGDVNNDGYSDMIIGAPSFDASGVGVGKAYLYLGGPGGPATTPAWTSLGEDQPGAAFGTSVASLGDLNNDGFSDVVIGASVFDTANPAAGKVYLYLGRAGGLDAAPTWSATGDDQPFSNFGEAVAGAGDVNQDGIPDLVVGAPGFDGVLEDVGKAYLYLGGGGTLSAVPDWTSSGDGDYAARLGGSLSFAGDVNDDGLSDVIIGAAGFNNQMGKAYLFEGRPGGLSVSPTWVSIGDGQIDAGYGRSVASAGDVDGDGISDVIIGAFTYTTAKAGAGKVYVFIGGAGGLSASPYWSTSGEDAASAQFGRAVSSAGDVTGDGLSEVLVGAPIFSPVTSGAVGKAYIFCVRP